MRKILLVAIVSVALTASLPLEAATPSEFYASLLRRGITAYDAGRNEEAARNLRLAAFGLIDSVDQYQTAHAYLALAYARLDDPRMRDSVLRVVRAERIERRFGSIAFPPAVRSAFQALAAKSLSPADMELLKSSPAQTIAGTGALARPVPAEAAGATPARPQTTQPPNQPQTSGGLKPAAPQETASKPVPPPVQKPAPETAKPAAEVTKPAPEVAKPAPEVAKPAPAPAKPAGLSASEVASRLNAAERALMSAQLTEARRIYRELLNASGVERATLIRVAEGFYRARDFPGALAAFDRIGALRRGEEPYRYYIAVALYETGQYAKARQELASALPFIEVTPDVARYRAKIEGATP